MGKESLEEIIEENGIVPFKTKGYDTLDNLYEKALEEYNKILELEKISRKLEKKTEEPYILFVSKKFRNFEILLKKRYKALFTNSDKEALNIIKNYPVAVVFANLDKNNNGFIELLEKVEKINSNIYRILIGPIKNKELFEDAVNKAKINRVIEEPVIETILDYAREGIRNWKNEESKKYFVEISKESFVPIVGIDTEGKIRAWNLGAENVFGYKVDEIIGKYFFKLIPRSIRHKERQKIQEVQEKGYIEDYLTEALTKDGKRISVIAAVNELKVKNKVRGYSVIIKGITDKEITEFELKKIYNHPYLIIGPSGAGKTELVKGLEKKLERIKPCIRYTTRSPRKGEIRGKEHYFITENEFEKIKDKGNFIFTYERYGFKIGIHKDVIEDLNNGFDVPIILNTEIEDAVKLKNIEPFKEAIPIYLYSRKEDYEKRLLDRNLSESELKKRLEAINNSLDDYYKNHKLIKYLVLSSSSPKDKLWRIGKTIKQVERIVEMERNNFLDMSYEDYHEMYINNWIKELTGFNLDELIESINKKREVLFDFPSDIIEKYADFIGTTFDYISQFFPKRVIAATKGYGIATILLEPYESDSIEKVPGGRKIILDLLKNFGFTLNLNDSSSYQKISIHGMIRANDNSLINDGSIISLTDILYDLEERDNRIKVLNIGFIKDYNENTKIFPLSKDEFKSIIKPSSIKKIPYEFLERISTY